MMKIVDLLTKGLTTNAQSTPYYPPGYTPLQNPLSGIPLDKSKPGRTWTGTGNWNTRTTSRCAIVDWSKRPNRHDHGNSKKARRSQEDMVWRFLEERLRVIEGIDRYGLDAVDPCLVLDVVLLVDFKTPAFDKYKGISCPRIHLAMYCRKIATHVHEDKILVHCFQDSLFGAALSWYVNLERGHIRTWKDLVEAFLKQYKYNEDIAPNRSRLQNMTKRDYTPKNDRSGRPSPTLTN
ncbi:hypothetical protein CR513_42658, partial [Mucuna pruriens]